MKRFLVLMALCTSALAQQPASRAEVLVLGTYHMSNPGRDIFNTNADDVLAPKRQAEIAELVAVLKKFNPTKIAVEADLGDDRIPKRYTDYTGGKHELSRNEVEQIGFRLAKGLGHKTVYPVDADGEFPWQRVVDYGKASGRSKELDAMMKETGDRVKAQNQYLASHTILETLLFMNSDQHVADDYAFYARAIHFGARLELPDAAHVTLERAVQDQLIARLYHALEARVVNADEQVQRIRRIARLFRERQ